VTIIKSTTGRVFGGYTSKSWGSNGGGVIADSSAFLFSVTDAAKFPITDPQKAITS